MSGYLKDAPLREMDDFKDIDSKWAYWKTLFLEIVKKNAPYIKIRVKKTSFCWISNHTKRIMKSRNYYLNKFRKTGIKHHWELYRGLRNKVKSLLKEEKRSYFESLCKDFKKKPGKVWNEINRTLGRKVK